MRKTVIVPIAAALYSLLSVNQATAATATVSFVQLSGNVAQGTTIFRADLSGLGFAEVQSITLVDSNSKSGGSPGQYSGFDLDAIKLSSTFATTAAQADAATAINVFDFSTAGTFFTPGSQRPPIDLRKVVWH